MSAEVMRNSPRKPGLTHTSYTLGARFNPSELGCVVRRMGSETLPVCSVVSDSLRQLLSLSSGTMFLSTCRGFDMCTIEVYLYHSEHRFQITSPVYNSCSPSSSRSESLRACPCRALNLNRASGRAKGLACKEKW
jgi:hypothetical protein